MLVSSINRHNALLLLLLLSFKYQLKHFICHLSLLTKLFINQYNRKGERNISKQIKSLPCIDRLLHFVIISHTEHFSLQYGIGYVL